IKVEAAPSVSLELASRGEQGANRVVSPDDLDNVRHWETIVYRRYTADRLSTRETRPTTTYTVAPADREPLHERLHGLGAVDEQRVRRSQDRPDPADTRCPRQQDRDRPRAAWPGIQYPPGRPRRAARRTRAGAEALQRALRADAQRG